MRALVSAKCDACDHEGIVIGPAAEISIKFDTNRVPTFWIQLCARCLKLALAELQKIQEPPRRTDEEIARAIRGIRGIPEGEG